MNEAPISEGVGKSDAKKKYVLIVTYYFPPAGGPGVQRILKFIKYLSDFGWTPVVLVPENPEYQALDPSLLKELPKDLIIRRAPIFEPYDLYRKFTGKAKGVSLDVNVIKEAGAKRSISERVAEVVRATLFIPDARIGWYWSAVKMGKLVMKEFPIEVIYSSSPPYTPALVARKLARLFRKPWIAGFRDPWTGFHNTPDRWLLPKKIDRSLERSVFTEAKLVDVAWNGITEDAIGKYSELPRNKFIHIPNGFDSADFPVQDITQRALRPKNSQFTITYSGSLYGPRNPLSFLKAIEQLIGANVIDATKLKLRFVGRFGAEIHDMLARPLIAPLVEKIDYVPHAKAVELLLDSDALLLIVDEVPSVAAIVPGKVYEYLGAMRPLIAIAPPHGAIGDLLRETGGGKAVSQSDIDGQAALILELYTDWALGSREALGAEHIRRISQYERREATRKLAMLFDRVTGKNS
jgi:glycosyltransferase involved in cell wall biosynthesis